MDKIICGECRHYRHPADGPECALSSKSIGYFDTCAKAETRDGSANTKKEETMDTTETKVCKECGRELPLEWFDRQARSKDGHMHICHECMKKKKTAGMAAAKAGSGKAPAPKPETPEAAHDEAASEKKRVILTAYTDTQLAEELRRRGYTGELSIIKTIII